MRQRIQEIGKNDKGFTLIELLIVVVILGILAGIVVFAVGGVSNRGESAACKANLKTAQVAVEAYYAKTKAYPDAGDAGWTQLTTPATKFLQEKPTGITLAANGVVTADPACPAAT